MKRKTTYRLISLALLLVIVAVAAILITSKPKPDVVVGIYVLSDNGTAIQKQGAREPFLRASELPDTVPTFVPHDSTQRFDNRRFHFICVSPNQRYIEFACGEGDQWLGMADVREEYVKFLMFANQATFYPGLWSPDSKFLTYGFYDSDRRLYVYITDPLGIDIPVPMNLNYWYREYEQEAKFKPIGWRMDTDTVFTFAVTSASGKELERVDLPLRLNPALLPEHMKPKTEPATQ